MRRQAPPEARSDARLAAPLAPGQNKTLLEARNLAQRRPDDSGWLLDHVSLGLAPGDRVAVAGPSGSGKTLFLRALALLDPVDHGAVFWHGQPVALDHVPHFRSRVIYLHQRPSLAEDTVENALRGPYSLAVHRHRRFDRDQVLAWLERLGRGTDFLRQTVRNLSGGELQITALVRALQLQPEVLLLDEPTAALDERAGRAVEGLLSDWVAEQPRRAMLWVSHDPDLAGRLGQRVVRFAGGRIVATGA